MSARASSFGNTAAGPRSITVEVAYAAPGFQFLEQVVLREGATAAEAVGQCGLEARLELAGLALPAMRNLGIFGKPVTPDAVLRPGDRVEVYRELSVDPKQARRERAAARKRRA